MVCAIVVAKVNVARVPSSFSSDVRDTFSEVRMTKLRLLGSPQIRFGHAWVDIPLTKPMLLLFYLAYYGDWVSRGELAFFFRPDADEATARHYVRKMLSDVRRLPWTYELEVEGERLRWRPETDSQQLAESVHAGRFVDALELYRGPFLGGLRVDSSPSFDAWLALKREELAALWQRACMGRVTELESAGEHREAAANAKILLQHDSLAEDALQCYIRNVYLAGQREVALRAAEVFRRELLEEMGLEPLEETTRLVKAIRDSQPVAHATAQRKHGRRRTDRAPLPPKEQELADLLALLGNPNARLLDLTASHTSKETLIIAHRLPNVSIALHAVTKLAERLMSQGHTERASELLQLILNHPLCDDLERIKIHNLQRHCHVNLPMNYLT